MQKRNQEDGLMAGKSRVPMQVSPAFENRIKKLQSDIMRKIGKKESLRDLTERVVRTASFDQVEKAILNSEHMDLKINFDRRKL